MTLREHQRCIGQQGLFVKAPHVVVLQSLSCHWHGMARCAIRSGTACTTALPATPHCNTSPPSSTPPHTAPLHIHSRRLRRQPQLVYVSGERSRLYTSTCPHHLPWPCPPLPWGGRGVWVTLAWLVSGWCELVVRCKVWVWSCDLDEFVRVARLQLRAGWPGLRQ